MCNLVALFTPQYGIIHLEDKVMGRPKKNFYHGDLGLSIREKMRQLDLEDRRHQSPSDSLLYQNHTGYYGERIERTNEWGYGIGLPVDQECDDWLERLYER